MFLGGRHGSVTRNIPVLQCRISLEHYFGYGIWIFGYSLLLIAVCYGVFLPILLLKCLLVLFPCSSMRGSQFLFESTHLSEMKLWFSYLSVLVTFVLCLPSYLWGTWFDLWWFVHNRHPLSLPFGLCAIWTLSGSFVVPVH